MSDPLVVHPTLTSDSSTWPRGAAVEVIINELTRLGHGPITDDGPGWGGYLKVTDAPSFILAVNEVKSGRWDVKIEWQSGLERTGYERTGRLAVDLDLVAIAQEIHEAIEQHKVALGIYQQQREDAERQLLAGIDRLHEAFDLDPFEDVTVGGKLDYQRRPRFEVSVADLTEEEAGRVLEALVGLGIIKRSPETDPRSPIPRPEP